MECKRPVRIGPEKGDFRYCGKPATHVAAIEVFDVDPEKAEFIVLLCDECADLTKKSDRCLEIYPIAEQLGG